MRSLSDTDAVVTGASRGIGRAIAVGLAEKGARVVAVARGREQLDELSSEMRRVGHTVIPVAADVATTAGANALAHELDELGVHPELLVNTVGTFGPIALVGESDPEEWIAAVQTNLFSVYRACNALVPGMVARGRGVILNASSAATLSIHGGNSAYGTSKSAVNHFSRQLAAELEHTGVVVNVFHPGDVRTEMFEDIRAKVNDANPVASAEYSAWIEAMDLSGGDDVRKAAELVVSVATAATPPNGQFLWIDGGITLPKPAW